MNEPQKLMFSQSIYSQSSVRKEKLGALRITDDGLTFRYALNGAVALAAGKPNISADMVANHTSIAVAANAAVGATQVSVTLGATAATAEQYAGGYLAIDEGAGIGTSYRIDSHPAIASAGTGWITLGEPIRVALTSAASKVSLVYNSYAHSVVSTAVTDSCNGVSWIAVTAAYYYWSQVHGLCPAVLTSGTPAIGAPLTLGAGLLLAVSAVTDPLVGVTTLTAGRANEYTPVELML